MAHWRVVSFFVLVLARAEERGFSVIQAHLAALHNSSVDPASLASCTISADEPCALSDLPLGERTLVYPGGDTRCLGGGAYAFEVTRGDPERVLFYFQGGGACWDELSTSIPLCSQALWPQSPAGWFDRADARNPLRGYTVVTALYCSGDAHVADNATQPWAAAFGRDAPARQTGQQNVAAALAWLAAQAYVRLPLARLVVSGESAGSLGAQAWSDALLAALPARARVVLPDSYLGIFPPGSQGGILRDTWPVCDGGGALARSLSPALRAACRAGNLTLQAWVGEAMARHGATAFAWIQSKEDAVQRAYYAALAATLGAPPLALGPDEFYRRANEVLLEYDAAPNAVHFLAQAAMHTYTEAAWFYSATPSGLGGGGGGPRLSEWVAGLVGSPPVASTECDGEQLEQAEWSGRAYCAKEMAGKVFSP